MNNKILEDGTVVAISEARRLFELKADYSGEFLIWEDDRYFLDMVQEDWEMFMLGWNSRGF
jgi:hypothetical protein